MLTLEAVDVRPRQDLGPENGLLHGLARLSNPEGLNAPQKGLCSTYHIGIIVGSGMWSLRMRLHSWLSVPLLFSFIFHPGVITKQAREEIEIIQ